LRCMDPNSHLSTFQLRSSTLAKPEKTFVALNPGCFGLYGPVLISLLIVVPYSFSIPDSRGYSTFEVLHLPPPSSNSSFFFCAPSFSPTSVTPTSYDISTGTTPFLRPFHRRPVTHFFLRVFAPPQPQAPHTFGPRPQVGSPLQLPFFSPCIRIDGTPHPPRSGGVAHTHTQPTNRKTTTNNHPSPTQQNPIGRPWGSGMRASRHIFLSLEVNIWLAPPVVL